MTVAFYCANKMICHHKFLTVKHLALYHHLHEDFLKQKWTMIQPFGLITIVCVRVWKKIILN